MKSLHTLRNSLSLIALCCIYGQAFSSDSASFLRRWGSNSPQLNSAVYFQQRTHRKAAHNNRHVVKQEKRAAQRKNKAPQAPKPESKRIAFLKQKRLSTRENKLKKELATIQNQQLTKKV